MSDQLPVRIRHLHETRRDITSGSIAAVWNVIDGVRRGPRESSAIADSIAGLYMQLDLSADHTSEFRVEPNRSIVTAVEPSAVLIKPATGYEVVSAH